MENKEALRILLGNNYEEDKIEKAEDNLSPELFQLLNPGKQLPINQPKETLEKAKEVKETNATIRKGVSIYSIEADKKYVMTRDFPTKLLVKASDLYTFDFKGQTFYVPKTGVEIDDDSEIIELKQKVKKRIEKSKENKEKSNTTVNLGLSYEQKIKDGLGLTRDKLPQIDEENLDDFLIHFSDKAKVKKVKVKLKDLKFTQGELDSEKVLSIMKDKKEGWKTRKYIISLDKYVLDGHHSIAAGLEIDEDTEVETYRVNVPMKRLIARVNKMKISNNLDIDDNEIKKSLDILEKAYNEGKIKEKTYFEALEKARRYKIGEISQSTGLKKVGDNEWIDPKTNKKVSGKEEVNSKNPKKKEDNKNNKPLTPEELSNHAKNSSEADLKAAAGGSDPKLREAAHTELERRKNEEQPKEESKVNEEQPKKESKKPEEENKKPETRKEKAKEKLKTIHEAFKERTKKWHQKQIEFYKSKEIEPGSEERKGMKEFLKKKSKGIIKGLKDEIHEYKEFGSGMKKFMSGKTKEITKHEKKAMITVGVHMGIMIGGMAMTGGLSSLASKGVAALSKGLAIHWLEHAGITRLGHALAFAKAEEDNDDVSKEDLNTYLEHMLNEMLQHIENGVISEEELLDLGDSSSNDFELLYNLEE